jgi:hypothetical protein
MEAKINQKITDLAYHSLAQTKAFRENRKERNN